MLKKRKKKTKEICNISGGPSEIPNMLAPWAPRLVALPGWSKGTPRGTRRCASWWYSRFSFRPVFWLSWWPSPSWTHWSDGPTHQEWPQDKVRPWGQSPGRNLPRWVEEEPDHFPGLPEREPQIGRPGDSGRREASWMITSMGLPGREQ